MSRAFAECRRWAKERGVDSRPYVYRVAFVLITESGGGRMYANEGAAFPDSGTTPWADNSLSTGQRRKIRESLSRSMSYPHDAVGGNGGSTGMYQQLSQDYVGARFPGKTWGWGTLADTMDVDKSTRMFLDRLQVTDNPEYRGFRYSDPLVADVLRVQQPLTSESGSSNYSAAQVARARRLVDNWSPTYFTDGNDK